MDNISKEKRSRIMASIRGKNTKPEMIIRKLLWSNGFRYRIHDKTVFGKPDISNKSKKLAIFVDGCFWHGCNRCYKEPSTNRGFWKKKISDNKKRRIKVRRELKKEGWTVIEIWEHEINNSPEIITEKISNSLK